MDLSQSFIYKTVAAATGNIKLRTAEVENGRLYKPNRRNTLRDNGLYIKPNMCFAAAIGKA